MGELTDKLKIGMSMHELDELLGQPVGSNPGSEMLSGSNVTGLGDVGALRSELDRTTYCMWRRPDGEYLLVLVDGCLARITSAPGYIAPAKSAQPVTIGKGKGMSAQAAAGQGTRYKSTSSKWRNAAL